MSYKKAKGELRRVGCANASGDSLRAMYAELLPLHVCLAQSTAKRFHAAERFYAHLQKFTEDSEISKEARRLIRTPLAACEVGL